MHVGCFTQVVQAKLVKLLKHSNQVSGEINQEPHQMFSGHIEPIALSSDDINAELMSLDTNSAMGPDGIHPAVLKYCAPTLLYPLHTIFSRSLAEGEVPMAWKCSTVIPIFKKGHRYEPLNYRPVSLTPVCCKVLEHIIANHLRAYLDDNALLSHHQFGFRQGRSTMDQLLLVYDEIASSVDAGSTVDLILFDYSKAFDVVSHKVLISKLHLLGIDGQLLSWIESFLSDRKMQVSVKGCLSSTRFVHSGVPQGSVLGPLLFLIYINHVGHKLTSKYKIFADDLKIYSCVTGTPGHYPPAAASIQNDIDILNSTSRSWGLMINREKCAILRFSRCYKAQVPPYYSLDGSPLPVCKSHLDLGVIVDVNLKFHEHVASVARKASGLCHSFLKSTVCRTPSFMMFLLKTHIRPLIEYASCVWNTGYREDLRRLERVQRMWTKHIDDMKDLTYAERLGKLGLYSVQGRLLRSDLIQYWKLFNGKCSSTQPEAFFARPLRSSTRGHRFKIHVSRVDLDVCKRSFSKRCVSAWNSLPEHVVAAPDISTFKKALESVIQEDLYRYVT